MYPSDGIHRRWENGYRITSMAATADQAAFILSIPKRKLNDETQETLRTTAFPSTHVKVCFLKFETKTWILLILCCYYMLKLGVGLVFVEFFAGQVGKKSIHCINMLWQDSVLIHTQHHMFCWKAKDNWSCLRSYNTNQNGKTRRSLIVECVLVCM